MSQPCNEVLVEFIQQGGYIKVSAVDARTGLEVSIVGDPKQSQNALQAAAVRKLHYVRNQRRKKREAAVMRQPRKYRSTSGWDM